MKAANIKMFIMVLVLAVVMIGGAFSIRSLARPGSPFAATDEQEITYRKQLKAVLKDCKASTAGINLSKKCVDGKTLEYEVVINLPKYINSSEKDDIMSELKAVCLGIEGATVNLSFSE